MIEEQGTVIELKGANALIRTAKTLACEGCASKDVCFSVGEADRLVEAQNAVNAKVGDRVVFTVGAGTVLRAGVYVYLLPLVAFIAGVATGQALSPVFFKGLNADVVSAVVGFAFLGAAFLGVRFLGSLAERKKTMRPAITRVVG